MWKRICCRYSGIAGVLLSAFLYALPAVCADDPNVEWQELESAHFIVHFPETRTYFARRALAIAEEAHERLQPLLEWMPEKTHITVVDNLDEANGWARSTPRNQIELYAYPPASGSELWEYDDWMRQLIYHEYTHILHTDHSTAGLHTVLNAIFGKFARSNSAVPRWYAEGLAVYYETKMSNTGRLRNSLYRVMIRQAVIDGTVPSLGSLSTGQAKWPGGGAAYLFGSHFIEYIAKKYGGKSLSAWNREYGDDWVPYAMNRAALKVWGKTFDVLYDEWRASAEKRAHSEMTALRNAGELTPHSVIAEPFRHKGAQPVPGRHAISYVRADGVRKQMIVIHDLDTGEETDAAACWGPCRHRWDSAGTLYFMHTTNQEGYRSREWLYKMNAADGSIEKVPGTERLRAFAVDGEWIYVSVQEAERTELRRVDPESGVSELIYQSRRFEQIDAFDVRSGIIAASVFDPAARRRDLAVFRQENGKWHKKMMTADRYLEISPVFGPDGAVYYAGDASGELNLWRISESGEKTRLTHLSDGMLDPVFDASGDVFYTQYTSSGTTIARIAARELYPQAQHLKDPAEYIDYDALDRGLDARPEQNPALRPARRYKPWHWLWPQTWSPRLSFSTGDSSVGLAFGGADFSTHHSYSFTLDYLIDRNAVDYAVLYIWSGLPWDISLYQGMTQNRAVYSPTLSTKRVYDYHKIYAGISVSHTWNMRMSSHYLGLQFKISHSESSDAFQWPAKDPRDYPHLPSLGWNNALLADWSWSNMQFSERLQTSGNGYSVYAGMRFEAPWIGADGYTFAVDASVRGAWSIAAALPQVFQIKLAGGAAVSDDPDRQPYALSSAETGVTANSLSADLYGYSAGSMYGRHYLYAHGSWMMLLCEPSLGISTLPIGLGKIRWHVFADWGYAWRESFDITRSKFDIGTKLDIEYVLGYRLPVTLSLTYAWGGAPGGGHAVIVSFGL